MDSNNTSEEVSGVIFETGKSLSEKIKKPTSLPKEGSNLFEYNFPTFKKRVSLNKIYWGVFLFTILFFAFKLLSFIRAFSQETSAYQDQLISEMKDR
ncbi:MAG: hypothetical protein NTZ13_04585 [Candidatus Parcubacteria bacterium]|nr:hypothetical protein [Candidatus Parcubacteria bacterium]